MPDACARPASRQGVPAPQVLPTLLGRSGPPPHLGSNSPQRATLPGLFFQEVRTLIFQPGPSWGQERKRTPQFHQEGRQAGGGGGKRSERSQTDSLPPTPAPRSTGSDRAHRWRPGNSVPLSEQRPTEEEEEEKGRTRLWTPRCWLGERRRTPKATTVTCGDRSLPPPPQRPSPRLPPKETS